MPTRAASFIFTLRGHRNAQNGDGAMKIFPCKSRETHYSSIFDMTRVARLVRKSQQQTQEDGLAAREHSIANLARIAEYGKPCVWRVTPCKN